MKKITIPLFLILGFLGCNRDKETITRDLNNMNGTIDIHRCECTASAYRYLIMTYKDKDAVFYNPINLSEDFKDANYKIVFSADLLNDSSVVYTNTATDLVIEAFKVRNIKLTNIKKVP